VRRALFPGADPVLSSISPVVSFFGVAVLRFLRRSGLAFSSSLASPWLVVIRDIEADGCGFAVKSGSAPGLFGLSPRPNQIGESPQSESSGRGRRWSAGMRFVHDFLEPVSRVSRDALLM
jgi:hypothetical protein